MTRKMGSYITINVRYLDKIRQKPTIPNPYIRFRQMYSNW